MLRRGEMYYVYVYQAVELTALKQRKCLYKLGEKHSK